jgi:glycosyltransferase involved in cell wall biosynthesis
MFEAFNAKARVDTRFFSIIVTTYNRPDALTAVLRGIDQQDDRYFEVIVADDGSEPDASKLASRYGARHVWQPHNGFRAAAIRNKAVAASRGEYLIFLDGDCVPRPSFTARHRALAEAGWFVAGNRACLSKNSTAELLASKRLDRNFNPVHLPDSLLLSWLRRDIDRLAPFLTLPIPRKLAPKRWTGAKSCNLGVWRSDFEHVGGFDEAYRGWGFEDSDLVIRMLRAGIRRKDGRFATGVVHLWHEPNDRMSLKENLARLQALAASAESDKHNCRHQSTGQ